MNVTRPSYRPAASPELRAHQEWIGFVQPSGLLVSLPALEKAQCYVNRNVLREQQALVDLVEPKEKDGTPAADARIADFKALVREVLQWADTDLVTADETFDVALPEYGEVLHPDFIVPADGGVGLPIALVSVVPAAIDLDKARGDTPWHASPEARLERMLRDAKVPMGLLFNGTHVRLVYAPSGESSGHATFDVLAMSTPAGRPIFAAFLMLLSAERMFGLPEAQRLPAILRESRRYQNEVSTKLSEQVLAALHELLRGFQAADEATNGALLSELRRDEPEHIYGGLLATLLRLVFLLYAEDRGIMPNDPVYARGYSVTGLFDKLRQDSARHPDTMDERFGAWARVLTLFRLVFAGGGQAPMKMPRRGGRIFDPDSYPFLEGRPRAGGWQPGERIAVPRVSDGVLLRVLENLLLLDGGRLSYRTLDVEQIGSVYEAMMGFAIEVATEPSIGLRARRKPGAPPADPVLGLETLLAKRAAERLAFLDDNAVDANGKTATAIKEASSIDELLAALAKKISPYTPEVIPAGHMVLQPTEERRRSGSHYTPRALTEPIVATTLRPLLDGLGSNAHPEQILDLKICDPAMGSGAFLVAACRALGDELVRAWQRHKYVEATGNTPARVVIPPDEDPVLHARRIVAQRCLYGVDKNPFAVDLAKLSLWLVTLAKDHPFTFLDHALKQGDSLVGLSRDQISSFHWKPAPQVPLVRGELDRAVARAQELRARIHSLGDSDDTDEKRRLLEEAEAAIASVRRVADLVIDAFFNGKNAKERETRLKEHRAAIEQHGLANLPEAAIRHRLRPFHWEIEFPEVFLRGSSSTTLAHEGAG